MDTKNERPGTSGAPIEQGQRDHDKRNPPDLLGAALAYAERGIPVFFLSRTKAPLANCANCGDDAPKHAPETCTCLTCHSFYRASSDPNRLRAMRRLVPCGMLGMRTGAASGLTVVDVDPRNGGHESMARLMQAGLLPPTSWVATGSDGAHFYYRHPGGKIVSRPLPGYPGIDIKADGALVVLPPSVHPNTGRTYEWRVQLDGLHEMHPSLVQLCRPVTSVPQQRVPTQIATGRGAGITRPDRLLETLLDKIRSAPEGARRRTLYGSARGAAKMVAAGALSSVDAVAALTDAAHAASMAGKQRLSETQIRNAIAGGFQDEGVIA